MLHHDSEDDGREDYRRDCEQYGDVKIAPVRKEVAIRRVEGTVDLQLVLLSKEEQLRPQGSEAPGASRGVERVEHLGPCDEGVIPNLLPGVGVGGNDRGGKDR